MNIENNQNQIKEIRQRNLILLKRAIQHDFIDEISDFDREWGGAYVVITSSPERVFNPETDEDWMGRRAACTYVLTQNAIILSKFIDYVGFNIMERQDNYLYGFMALLANDFIRQFGDPDNHTLLLDYIFSGIAFYLSYYNWENGMGNPKNAFDLMRFFLSENISNEEINHIL